LLHERRKSLHRLVAATIEELYSDRVAEHYETLAHHYYEGQEWEKALDYLMKSAQKAADAYANKDALDYFGRALEAASHVDRVPVEAFAGIYGGRAQVFLTMSQWNDAVASYRELVELAREAGDRKVEGLALGGFGFTQVIAHDFESAESASKEALAIADELDDDAVRTGALMIPTFLEALRGRVGSSMDYAERTAELAKKTSQPLYETFCDELFILGYSWRGLFEQAHKNAIEGVARAERHGITEALAFNKWASGVALASNGRYTDAITTLGDAIAFCERIGDKAVRSRAWNTLGWVHGELGDFERGIRFNQEGLDLAADVGDPEITINAQLNLADYAFVTGEVERAQRELEELYASLPGMHEWMKWRYSQHLMHSLGEVVLAGGEADRALRLADECLELAESTESRKNVVKGRRLRGQALAASGRLDEAEKDLSTALDVAKVIGNPPQLWKTWFATGELRESTGDAAGAREAYVQSLAVLREVAAELTDENLRERFLDSGEARAIEEAAGADVLETRS
jgi:tetratricopeptide (TPR) repeat protein